MNHGPKRARGTLHTGGPIRFHYAKNITILNFGSYLTNFGGSKPEFPHMFVSVTTLNVLLLKCDIA